MTYEGGCYCKALRYEAEGEPGLRGECLCRECQYITGGGPNFFMAMPLEGFRFTRGTPKSFTRSDLEKPVTRFFCADCGTHVATRPVRPGVMIVKVGTLDDPKAYGGPTLAIFAVDRQPFHHLPADLPTYERRPG